MMLKPFPFAGFVVLLCACAGEGHASRSHHKSNTDGHWHELFAATPSENTAVTNPWHSNAPSAQGVQGTRLLDQPQLYELVLAADRAMSSVGGMNLEDHIPPQNHMSPKGPRPSSFPIESDTPTAFFNDAPDAAIYVQLAFPAEASTAQGPFRISAKIDQKPIDLVLQSTIGCAGSTPSIDSRRIDPRRTLPWSFAAALLEAEEPPGHSESVTRAYYIDLRYALASSAACLTKAQSASQQERRAFSDAAENLRTASHALEKSLTISMYAQGAPPRVALKSYLGQLATYAGSVITWGGQEHECARPLAAIVAESQKAICAAMPSAQNQMKLWQQGIGTMAAIIEGIVGIDEKLRNVSGGRLSMDVCRHFEKAASVHRGR